MQNNVEISPKWLQAIYFGEEHEVSEEVVDEAKQNGLVFVIEAVRAIDAFEAYNDLMCTVIPSPGKHLYVYLSASELVYVGQDGAHFSIAFKLKRE